MVTLYPIFLTASFDSEPLDTNGIFAFANFLRSASLNLSNIFISCLALAALIVLPLKGSYSLFRVAIIAGEIPASEITSSLTSSTYGSDGLVWRPGGKGLAPFG